MAEEKTNCEATVVVDEQLRRVIAGAVAEVDLAQIAVLRQMTPAERCRQAVAMIGAGERVATYRLRQQQPQLTEAESLRKVRHRGLVFRERIEERWRKNL